LAQETQSQQLSDMHIFADARRVTESLKGHDCSAALVWCAENRARLKKIKSSLEFKLRLQEFLELVRQVPWRREGMLKPWHNYMSYATNATANAICQALMCAVEQHSFYLATRS
jgi:hypothetical protein